MLIKNKKGILQFLVMASIVSLSVGCSKKDSKKEEGSTEADKLVHAVIVGQNAYISRLKDLTVTTVDNSNAVEHDGTSYLYVYKESLFVLESSLNRITKYVKNGNEGMVKADVLSFPAGAGIQGLAFLNDNKAYVSYKSQGKLAVIDPQSMSIQKEIDLGDYAVGQNDNNPDPVQMKIDGNRLYVSLYQEKATFTPQELAAFVLIIDTETDTVIKLAKDARGLCFVGSSDPDESMLVDEKGDMYLYCNSGFGYIPGVKDGFLRIKKGETAFDPTYLFTVNDKNIPDAPGNKASYIYHKVYIGNGRFVCFMQIPSLTSNPPDFVNDRNYQAYEVDVYKQTFKKINIKPTAGYSCALSIFNNQVLMGVATTDGIGYYTYDISSGTVSTGPVVKTQGNPYYILPF